MKAQQVIYTSCKRGIEGSSSGFQNYSYSPQIKAWSDQGNRIGELQSYNAPRIDGLPSLPTKEQAQTLYPRRQIFGRITGTSDLYGMALCSYIGRDYPEGSVRGGNFISHALVMPAAQVDDYPCKYIDSPSFLRWMDREQAAQDQTPAPLPIIDVEQNPAISLETVRSFLDEEDNADVFGQMLRCLLLRKEGGVNRKLLINDSEENFALWVAALEMALPVRQSLDFSFSFYEYDPSVSGAEIIRMVDGTARSISDSAFAYNYIFDFATGNYAEPAVADDDADAFCDFAVTALRYAPESLTAFHQYLDHTSYTEAGSGIGTAYTLCQINAGLVDLTDLDDQRLSRLYEFLEQYGASDQRRALFDTTAEAMRETLFEASAQQVLHQGLVKLAGSDSSLSIAAPEILLELMIELFTTSGVSEQQYAQTRDIAAGLFTALGRDVDVELFNAVTADANADLGLDSTGSIPWTVRAYADLASRALLSTMSSGIQLPLGGSAEQMLNALGADNAGAVRKLVSCIVRHPDPRMGIAVFEALESQWASQPSLTIMLSLLVLCAQPHSQEISNVAISRLWNVFLAGDERTRILCCQSLVSSGLKQVAVDHLQELAKRSTNDPEDFYRFLQNLIRALPKQFMSEYVSKLTELCWQVKRSGLSGCVAALRVIVTVPGCTPQLVTPWLNETESLVPICGLGDADRQALAAYRQFCGEVQKPLGQRGVLAEHLLRVEQLVQTVSTRHPDQMVVQSLYATLCKEGPLLPLQAAGAQLNSYIDELAQLLAQVVTENADLARLQTALVSPSHQSQMVADVLQYVIEQRKTEQILTLMAIDTPLVMPDRGPAVATIGQFASAAAGLMVQNKVKLASLDKIVTDEKQLDKFIGRFEKSFGQRDQRYWAHFQQLYDATANLLEQKEEASGPGLFGFMKKLRGPRNK